MDRLDVCTERIALVLGPDSVLAIARYVGKPAAAWTGDHAASFSELASARIGTRDGPALRPRRVRRRRELADQSQVGLALAVPRPGYAGDREQRDCDMVGCGRR